MNEQRKGEIFLSGELSKLGAEKGGFEKKQGVGAEKVRDPRATWDRV